MFKSLEGNFSSRKQFENSHNGTVRVPPLPRRLSGTLATLLPCSGLLCHCQIASTIKFLFPSKAASQNDQKKFASFVRHTKKYKVLFKIFMHKRILKDLAIEKRNYT